MRDILIGTAGHIDHGKTTLLKALTGIDADRLAEEKRRGITIDLGFAHLELGEYRLGFIDVPGHERFVKNMLAGIGGIRLVLLVVAADESIMPQTREHFQICKLLNIPGGLIVLTKADLVEEELLELVQEEVRELVADSFLQEAPIVAVDSLSGRGMDAFKKALLDQAEGAAASDREVQLKRSFRLPIDRVFSLRGFGTVVTGTAASGVLEADSAVQVYPSSLAGKVRSIQVFDRKEPQAWAGQRTALNLTGVDKGDLKRGMVVSRPGALEPTSMLDVQLQLLPDAPAPLGHRSPIRFHQGSSEVVGRVFLLGPRQLAPGETAPVQLRLQAPTVCCPGDRFIIRRYSPMRTIGGGVVLDTLPQKHTRKELETSLPRLRQLLQELQPAPGPHDSAFLRYFVGVSRGAGISLTSLQRRMGLTESALVEALSGEPEIELLPGEPRLAITRRALAVLQQSISHVLRSYHEQHPLSPGMPQPELKMRCLAHAPEPLFQALLAQLEQQELAKVTAGTVRLASHQVELSSEQAKLKDSILACFKDEQLQSPSLDELTQKVAGPDGEIRKLFFHLLQQNVLVRITPELVLSRRQLDWLLEKLYLRFEKGSAFEVAEFKDLFSITRKYAIPLLEYLDRQRVTRRAADRRILL